MGRHLWRLLRPAFLIKMLRTRAASLYGWDILLQGTLWPGRQIGKHLSGVIRQTHLAGHEVGVHSWDHHAWQMRSDRMDDKERARHVSKAFDTLSRITGNPVLQSAVAGWKCTDGTLLTMLRYDLRYQSDCRGTHIFRPVVNGIECTPQIPVTLPTYDEMIGRDGITDENFNERLLDMIRDDRLNVLTVHAEVEGAGKAELFSRFLQAAKERHIRFTPLGKLLPGAESIPLGRIRQATFAGREGTLCVQDLLSSC
jgi:undecaprenyl phosphate-alpha-L-ara4FN deformylase